MDTPEKKRQLEGLGEEIFGLTQLTSRARAQARKGSGVETLTETENLTLDLLKKHGVMTVGAIQKEIGVLPAQMSRIVRAMEDKGGVVYIRCTINATDRRKIDVAITPEGLEALEAYRSARMDTIVQILSVLDQPERDEFMRILRKIRDHISKSIFSK